jgi:hypothetical protein
MGVQFVGSLASDGLLLRLAAQLEQAQPWFHRYADLDQALTSSAPIRAAASQRKGG